MLAIKQTLYRTGGDPRIVGALMNAVKNGKQVTAVTELKARFDEANNILWARRLEEAGVHVVYGIVNHKVHCKVALVVRRDEDGLRRYVHLGTGNYNPSTARLYTDLSLFTAHAGFRRGRDESLQSAHRHLPVPRRAKSCSSRPSPAHDAMMKLIKRETENALQKKPARIIAKMNALVDREIIEALYRASQAGVKIDLIVRGICCLRPGRRRASARTSPCVRSSAAFSSTRASSISKMPATPKVFVGSADWMPRNFFRRIEVVFPIEEPAMRERVLHQILAVQLADNTKAWVLESDGSYRRPVLAKGAPVRNSQEEFIASALGVAKLRRKTKVPDQRRKNLQIVSRPV